MADWTPVLVEDRLESAADRKPWKLICWEIGISRATVNRRWQYGIAIIVWRLNGRQLSARRSMNHVIRQAREV